MAGMLPGVEFARRRRLHQRRRLSDLPTTSTAVTGRTPFCLNISSSHENYHLKKQKSITKQVCKEEKLEGIAGEAKERLDERLRAFKKSQSRRQNSGSLMSVEPKLQTEIFGSKRRFCCAKLIWWASDQDDCAICLQRFRAGEMLAHLPCAHRYHAACLMPWLESNRQCPCCRMGILC